MCLAIDGVPFTDEVNISMSTYQYRDFDAGVADGCAEAIRPVSKWDWNAIPFGGFTIEDSAVGVGLASGKHTATFTLFDSKGRSVSVSREFIRCEDTCGFRYSDGTRA